MHTIGFMLNQSFNTHRWTFTLPRHDHPLVQHYLRRGALRHFKPLVFGCSVVLLLLLGGLGLPVLYLLLSLLILVQTATGTAERIYHTQEIRTWDLLRATPYSGRDILLSAWAAGVWQLRRTWTMPVYRLLHALVIVGALVFGLWMEEIPAAHWSLALLGATLLIAAQPAIELYFSGMIGLLCASLIADRALSLGAAGLVMIGYWMVWLGGAALLLAADLDRITSSGVAAIFALPLLLPLLVGYAAQRIAERRLS